MTGHVHINRPVPLARTSEIRMPLLELPAERDLWTVWHTATQVCHIHNKAFPAQADIELTLLRSCIGHLMLLDVVDGGRDFWYRLYGSNLARVTGRDMSTRYVSEEAPELAEFLGRIYRDAVAEREPMFLRMRTTGASTVSVWERLILPLSNTGDRIDQLLVGAFPRGFRRLPSTWG